MKKLKNPRLVVILVASFIFIAIGVSFAYSNQFANSNHYAYQKAIDLVDEPIAEKAALEVATNLETNPIEQDTYLMLEIELVDSEVLEVETIEEKKDVTENIKVAKEQPEVSNQAEALRKIKEEREQVAQLQEPASRGSVPMAKEAPPSNKGFNQDLNSYVLDVIKTYPTGTSYPYLLNNDYANYNGVTTNIFYKDSLIAKAHPSGNRANHCTGITFEVFFRAMQERNKSLGLDPDDFNGMTAKNLNDFLMLWYVAAGPKKVSNIEVAIEKYGLGRRITNFEDAKAGDFMDLSRENHTGHTVVFMNWLRKDGQIIGLRYWSSQQSTGGINYKDEYFNISNGNGGKYGNVMINQVYMARVGSVNDYRSFR